VTVVPAATPPPEPPSPAAPRKPAARPRPTPPEDEPDDREEPRPKKKKTRRADGWKGPRTGVLLLLVGAALSLLGYVLALPFVAGLYLGGNALAVSILALVTLTFVLGSAYLIAELIGLVLCLFAPPTSGTRPLVTTAVACKVVAAVLAVVTTVATQPHLRRAERALRTNQLTRDGKVDRQRLDEMKAEVDQLLAEQSRALRLQRLLAIPSTIVSGITAAVIPLMLRGFCRALGLTESEPLCERLLQIGIGTFGFQILVQILTTVVGIGVLGFLTPLSYLAALLGFVWHVMYIILLATIWRAMPRRR
jgi:hypothetical protein